MSWTELSKLPLALFLATQSLCLVNAAEKLEAVETFKNRNLTSHSLLT